MALPLDLFLVDRGHTPTVYFYHAAATGGGDFFDVPRLKESMARALVAFYPLAGRLGVGGDGRAVIDCNAEGVLLVVARSELTKDDFSDPRPSPELKRLFVPRVDQSAILLGIQVTFLRCGGVGFGTALNHVASDAIGAFHFFQTWSTFSRDGAGAAVEPPCHDRTLLRARSPPFVCPDALSVLCPTLRLTPATAPVASEVFTIPRDRLAALKLACGGASTFCSVSALVWRCVCAARVLPPEAKTRLTLPANVRRAVKPPLPEHYFGNALVFLGAVAAALDVTTEAVATTASRIRAAVGLMDDGVVRSAIDYFELLLAEKGDYRPAAGSLPETELRVVSWLGMPVYDADYGWGKRELFFRAESWRPGLVYLISDGAAGVRVVVCDEAARLKKFGRLLNHAKF